jgi:hypothetical protein
MSGIVLEHFHGAACRVAPTATAFPHRRPGFNLVYAAEDEADRVDAAYGPNVARLRDVKGNRTRTTCST